MNFKKEFITVQEHTAGIVVITEHHSMWSKDNILFFREHLDEYIFKFVLKIKPMYHTYTTLRASLTRRY